MGQEKHSNDKILGYEDYRSHGETNVAGITRIPHFALRIDLKIGHL